MELDVQTFLYENDVILKNFGHYPKFTKYHRDPYRMLNNASKWQKTFPWKARLNNLKRRSREIGVPFNLTLDDLVHGTHCPLLEIEFSDVPHSEAFPEVDRIIPEFGYVKGNIQIISRRANRIKSNASLEELKLIAKNLEAICKE